jgi:hypothetical protein
MIRYYARLLAKRRANDGNDQMIFENAKGSRFPRGAVYVLENRDAQRVKVGMTAIGVNDVADRLRDVNDMWLERKVTCQICAGRLVNVGGRVPRHVKSGLGCPGGDALPLEKTVALAELHRDAMQHRLSELSGVENASAIRIINTLQKRIEKFRHRIRPVGEWQFSVAFYLYTDGVAAVESLSHKILAQHLDGLAPFGEVFCCSVTEATEAVESALGQLGLIDSAVKRHPRR